MIQFTYELGIHMNTNVAATWPDGAMAVCRKWFASPPGDVIIPEPYVPFVPEKWNGILVLAESQHLAGDNKYVEWLRKRSSDQRMQRMGSQDGDCVGVGPWDNGVVKLALKALLPDIELAQVAVGNAVPWSRCDGNKNANPSKEMQLAAVGFWRDLLEVWRPEFRMVLPLGKIAREVAAKVEMANRIPLRLPSPNNINRICGMFDKDDLLGRYPEVRRAGQELGIELELSNVFFACHAVSLGRVQLGMA